MWKRGFAAAVLLAAAGCSPDDPPDATSPTPAATPSRLDEAELADRLLTVKEAGLEGFVAVPYASDDTHSPCSDASLDTAPPPELLVGTTIVEETIGAQLVERAVVYPSPALAVEAMTVIDTAFTCGDPEDEGDRATVRDEDVSAEIDPSGGSTSRAWEVLGDDGTRLVLVATASGSLVTTLTFFIPPGTEPAALPDPVEVATLAFEKLGE